MKATDASEIPQRRTEGGLLSGRRRALSLVLVVTLAAFEALAVRDEDGALHAWRRFGRDRTAV